MALQGSGIGPLLFLTCINELASILAEFNVTVKLFADDVKLYAEVITDGDAEHFSHAFLFLRGQIMWQLQVSTPKCCILQLNARYACSSIAHFTINGAPLPAYDNVWDLGSKSMNPYIVPNRCASYSSDVCDVEKQELVSGNTSSHELL